MFDDCFENPTDVQVLTFKQFIDDLAEWPETREANLVHDNRAEITALYLTIRPVLEMWAEVGVELSWEVLLAKSFAGQFKDRYRESGDSIRFDRAIRLAGASLPCHLPNAFDDPSGNAGLPPIGDHELLAVDAMRKDRVPELIQQSHENPVAFRALQALLEFYRSIRLSAPPELQSWGLDVAAGILTIPKLGRGRSPYANMIRDDVIVNLVQTLVECGLTATRNEVSDPESACDAVSIALQEQGVELTYEGVVKVWTKGKGASGNR